MRVVGRFGYYTGTIMRLCNIYKLGFVCTMSAYE